MDPGFVLFVCFGWFLFMFLSFGRVNCRTVDVRGDLCKSVR